MIIKVAADLDILQEGGCDVKELVWTLSASQAFIAAIPALKKMLRIITITSGFTEHGYDLYTVRHTSDGPRPDVLIDVMSTPDMYGMRSGTWVYVKRLAVSGLTAVLTKEVVKCGEPFEVLVRASDCRGNARPLPSGGRVRLFPKLLNPSLLNSSAELLGDLTQGTGDGRQTEFHFSKLRIDHSGKYIIRTEHAAPSAQSPVSPGSTKILTVSAEPHPLINGCVVKNIGKYAFEFRFAATDPGHLCYLVFKERIGGWEGLNVQDVRTLAMRCIEMERNKGAMLTTERPVDEGEGHGVCKGCVAGGVLDVGKGLQTAQIIFKPVINDVYIVLGMADNRAGTNPNPEMYKWTVTATLPPPEPPILTNAEVQSTASGKGGLKFTFDSSEPGNIHYIVTLENVYHPVEAEEVISDVKRNTPESIYGCVGCGTLAVGRGLGHSAFVFMDGLTPGKVYDFWWAAEPLDRITKNSSTLPDLPPPQRIPVVIPFEDPPHISSFSLLPIDNRPAIRVHFETDCPGTVYFMLAKAGRGHLISPTAVVEMAKRGLPVDRTDVISVCTFAAIASGPHNFVVSHPVPKELSGVQWTRKLEAETAYEGFYLSDNVAGNNLGLKVSVGYPVVLPEVIEEEEVNCEAVGVEVEAEKEKKPLEAEPCEHDEMGYTYEDGDSDSSENVASNLQTLLFTRDPMLEDGFYPSHSSVSVVRRAVFGDGGVDTKTVRDQFVAMQQRVLDLESTLTSCKLNLSSNLKEAEMFESRAASLKKDLQAKRNLGKGLEEWKAKHNDMIREQVMSEVRGLESECDLVREGNRQWEERVKEAEDCNTALRELIAKMDQKRGDFIKALEERCVSHKLELKRAVDRMDEVIALRKVKEEQDDEIQALSAHLAILSPIPPPDATRARAHHHISHLEEPEPEIVSRALMIPKGGLRVLTTINGTGLQAMRFKHHVCAEIINVDNQDNELRVTGEATNVLQFIKEVEAVYEELKLTIPGPPRLPIF